MIAGSVEDNAVRYILTAQNGALVVAIETGGLGRTICVNRTNTHCIGRTDAAASRVHGDTNRLAYLVRTLREEKKSPQTIARI